MGDYEKNGISVTHQRIPKDQILAQLTNQWYSDNKIPNIGISIEGDVREFQKVINEITAKYGDKLTLYTIHIEKTKEK